MDDFRVKDLRLTDRECLFLAAIVLKMLVQVVSISVIPDMVGVELCETVFKVMTYISYALALVLFVTTKDMFDKELIRIFLITAVILAGSYFSGTELLFVFIYIYGAKDVSIKKVFVWAGVLYIFLFLTMIFLSWAGMIENWDFFALSDRPRWGLGYSYPSHASTVQFMSFLVFCCLLKERLTLFWVAVLEILNYWLYVYLDARAGFGLCLIVPVVFYCLKFRKKSLQKSKPAWLMQWSFPVCAIVILLMTVCYNGEGALQFINSHISDRLNLGNNAIKTYGIHLVGQKIQWVGWGGFGHSQSRLEGEYNYVDTAYLKLLMDNGLLVWILIISCWTMVCVKAYRTGERYLLCALTFLAIYCMIEHWLMDLGANLFVVFLGWCIYKKVPEESYETVGNGIHRRVMSP